jgi:hypothetical protein
MQAHYPEFFEREMGCTEAELRQWLPGACKGRPVEAGEPLEPGGGTARVPVGAGHLSLAWRVLPPRQIALLRVPRLAVAFRFDGVEEGLRHDFMRYFDLHTQRGGG